MFTFRLQKVLDYKIRLFEEARDEFLSEKARLAELNAELETQKYDYQSCLLKLIGETESTFDIKGLGIHYKYLFFVKSQMQNKYTEVTKQELLVSQKRAKMVELLKEKDVLIKLKEKARLEYDYEQDRQEQKMFDDISNSAYVRAISS